MLDNVHKELDSILNLVCTTEENRQTLNRALKQIKVFENNKYVPIELLEIYIAKVTKKYNVSIQGITHVCYPDREETYWTVSLKLSDTHKWLGMVHGLTLRELTAKCCFALNYMIQNKIIVPLPKQEVQKNE